MIDNFEKVNSDQLIKKFVFNFDDDPHNGNPPKAKAPKSEAEIKADELSKEIFDYCSKLSTNATSTIEYLTARLIFRLHGKLKNLKWMFENGGTTLKEIIEDVDREEWQSVIRKDAVTLLQLKNKLDKLEKKDGFARIVIKKLRNKKKEVTGYAVLAAYPHDSFVLYDGLDKKVNQESTNDHIVFYQSATACLSHACNDLYDSLTDGIGYIPVVDLVEANSKLLVDDRGVAEYMIYKKHENGESIKVTQGTIGYLTVALCSEMGGEENRIRISDFWDRK